MSVVDNRKRWRLLTGDPVVRAASTTMALATDGRLLGPMADVSAYTGIMLAAATPWGFFRHWWVLVKFGITLVQLYVGIFLLSPQLQAVRGRRRGGATASAWVFVAAVAGGFLDLALAMVLGHPMPLLSIVLLIVVLARRRSWTPRTPRMSATGSP
jgi:hypothetical protein